MVLLLVLLVPLGLLALQCCSSGAAADTLVALNDIVVIQLAILGC
jgi:hypothetical protein